MTTLDLPCSLPRSATSFSAAPPLAPWAVRSPGISSGPRIPTTEPESPVISLKPPGNDGCEALQCHASRRWGSFAWICCAVLSGNLCFGAPGDKLWEFDTGQVIEFDHSPAIAEDGTVYIGTRTNFDALTGKLWAIDGRSGTRKWDVPIGMPLTSPVLGLGGESLLPNGLQGLHTQTRELLRWILQVGRCRGNFLMVATQIR